MKLTKLQRNTEDCILREEAENRYVFNHSYEKDGDIERELTDDEYYNFIKLSGSKIKGDITDNLPKLNGMEKSDVQDKIDAIKTKARKDAKWELFGIGKPPPQPPSPTSDQPVKEFEEPQVEFKEE